MNLRGDFVPRDGDNDKETKWFMIIYIFGHTQTMGEEGDSWNVHFINQAYLEKLSMKGEGVK